MEINLQNIDFPYTLEYRSGTKHEPFVFFLDSLCNSNHFDILLGYFSSSAIRLLSLGFAKFLANGGKARFIINQFLTEKDKTAFIKGKHSSPEDFNFNIDDIGTIINALDDNGKHFFECLAWMITKDLVQIKIIKPKEGRGISHYKSGIFSDNNNKIKFKGSCNFTATAFIENLEELDLKLSWENQHDVISIEEYQQYFDDIFLGKSDLVEYIPFESAVEVIINKFGNKELDELLHDEIKLVNKKQSKFEKNTALSLKLNKIKSQLNIIRNTPRFPYPEGPREYQINAYKNWTNNNFNGIFAMATGTGKTITSLNCLLSNYRKTNSYKAVILVPTVALLEQWKGECKKFNFKNIITISSKDKWSDALSFFNTASKLTNSSYIVIVTYSSFTRPKFQSHFKILSNETVLIADELHNIGSPSIIKLLPDIHLEKRIGLSATPNRKYDDIGNVSIQEFFNDKPPYVFSYTMKEAMDNIPPALCRYRYYPHIVYLDNDELEEYIRISKQLLKYLDSVTQTYKNCKEVEILLLSRKRIIHKARNKKDVFTEILKKEFGTRENLNYTLIYVPEGADPDFISNDLYIDSEDDIKLIDEYTKIVSSIDKSIMVKKFTSNTSNRDQVLKDFAAGKLNVLTSMKCLDEGVDVPRSELAIFCASTGNPRQFIQRRGRVLRLHKDKIYAVIHDLVVVPTIENHESNYEMERNLIKKELERVVDFSDLSMNKIDTYEELKEILDYYNLSLYDLNEN